MKKENILYVLCIMLSIIVIILGILVIRSNYKMEENINKDNSYEEDAYVEKENQVSEQSQKILLFDGIEIERKTGIQELSYMKNTSENKKKYEIEYINYEKGNEIGEEKGIFGETDVYDGYSYVENVRKVAISEKYDAMPRTAVKLDDLPEELIDLADSSDYEIEKIDLDNDGKQEYIVCINQYINSEDYEDVSENETDSEIMLLDSEFKKVATLATWENKGVEELSKEMCLQLDDVVYVDIDNDGVMEILIELPAYDSSILSVIKYSGNEVQGSTGYKVNIEP